LLGLDLLVAGIGNAGQQVGGGHDLAGLAVTALSYVLLNPGLLQRVQICAGEALNRGYLQAVYLGDGGNTGASGATVYVHGAGTAQAGPATKLGAGQSSAVTQYPQQRFIAVAAVLEWYAVNPKLDHEKASRIDIMRLVHRSMSCNAVAGLLATKRYWQAFS
jgi:hypothetical protein